MTLVYFHTALVEQHSPLVLFFLGLIEAQAEDEDDDWGPAIDFTSAHITKSSGYENKR